MLAFVLPLRWLRPGLLILTALAFELGLNPSPLSAQEWAVNKGQSRVSLQLSMDGQSIEGRFGGYKMEIDFDPEEPSDGKIAASIETASVQTGDPQRDAMLVSPEWLGSGAFPSIRLGSRAIREIEPGSYRMEVDLTVKGVTKHVAVALMIDDQGAEGRMRAEINASQSAFGIGPAGSGEEMRIVFDLKATHLTN